MFCHANALLFMETHKPPKSASHCESVLDKSLASEKKSSPTAGVLVHVTITPATVTLKFLLNFNVTVFNVPYLQN